MLMKKIFILLMVGSLLFSCQITDVLNQEPPHNLTPDNAITDEKSAETALTGIYGEQIGYESYMSIGNHAMTAGILQRNDNPGVVVSIYYIENRLPELNLVGAAYTPFWDAFNTIINSSTKLLAVLEGMSDNLFTDGRKTTMMGEIRFLRGWYMFDLLRMFGEYDKLDSKYGMIIRETPPTSDDVYKARSTVQQTYDFILKDIEYAISNAPDFTSSDFASKMAAKALKVKVLFYMGKYSEALEAANTFIGDGERALVAPYSAVFTDFSNQELIYTRGFAGTDEVKYQDILHSFIRSSDIVEIASYSPFVNVCGAIVADEEGVLKRSQYYVFELFSRVFRQCDEYVETHMEGEVYSLPEVIDYSNRKAEAKFALDAKSAQRIVKTDYIDCVAAMNDDHSRLSISLINKNSEDGYDVELSVLGSNIQWNTGKCYQIYHDDFEAYNTRENPENISVKEAEGILKGHNIHLNPHSITVLVVNMEK